MKAGLVWELEDLGGAVWDFLRGGGYLGMGIGGAGGGGGGVEFFVNLGSFEGGVEGSEEKRLKPGSDATMAIFNTKC